MTNKRDIEKSPELSRIIFCIAKGHNYARDIAKTLTKDSTTVVRQLQKLEKLRYISSKKEKILNKTIYSVNWKKIMSVYSVWLGKKFKLAAHEYRKLKIDKYGDIPIGFLEEKNIPKLISESKHILLLLKEIFKTQENYKYQSVLLEDIFQRLTNLIGYGIENGMQYQDNKPDTLFPLFKKFFIDKVDGIIKDAFQVYYDLSKVKHNLILDNSLPQLKKYFSK